MVFLLVTTAFAYLIDAFFVGALLAFWRLHGRWHVAKRIEPFVLMGVFLFLDCYWLPAVMALDARIIIGNARVAEMLGVAGEFPLIDLFTVGWFGIVMYGVQVIIAVWVAERL